MQLPQVLRERQDTNFFHGERKSVEPVLSRIAASLLAQGSLSKKGAHNIVRRITYAPLQGDP